MAKKRVDVAIAGATGAVGAEFLKLLAERDYPIGELRLLASSDKDYTLDFDGRPHPVTELRADSFEGIDHAFFSAGGSISKQFAPAAVEAGAVVIDNSSAFRLDPDVPLVVPEINPEAIGDDPGIIANPNCTTIVALMAMAPLHRAFGIERAVMSSYQAISGAGARAQEELAEQLKDWAAGRPVAKPEHQPKQIAFNVIPRIDAVQDNLYTKEEMKFPLEGRKILGHPALRATATCVRVPVMRSHAVSLNLELASSVSRDAVIEALTAAPGVVVEDDAANEIYPTPLEHAERAEVSVGRIRIDESVPDARGLALWVVGDQLGKGAALNAIQIGELLLSR